MIALAVIVMSCYRCICRWLFSNLLNQDSVFVSLACSFKWIFLGTQDSVVTIRVALAWIWHIFVRIVILEHDLLWFAIHILIYWSILVLKINFALWNLILIVSVLVIMSILVNVRFLPYNLISFCEVRFILALTILFIYILLSSITHHLTVFGLVVKLLLLQLICHISISILHLQLLASFGWLESLRDFFWLLKHVGWLVVVILIWLRNLCNLCNLWCILRRSLYLISILWIFTNYVWLLLTYPLRSGCVAEVFVWEHVLVQVTVSLLLAHCLHSRLIDEFFVKFFAIVAWRISCIRILLKSHFLTDFDPATHVEEFKVRSCIWTNISIFIYRWS